MSTADRVFSVLLIVIFWGSMLGLVLWLARRSELRRREAFIKFHEELHATLPNTVLEFRHDITEAEVEEIKQRFVELSKQPGKWHIAP